MLEQYLPGLHSPLHLGAIIPDTRGRAHKARGKGPCYSAPQPKTIDVGLRNAGVFVHCIWYLGGLGPRFYKCGVVATLSIAVVQCSRARNRMWAGWRIHRYISTSTSSTISQQIPQNPAYHLPIYPPPTSPAISPPVTTHCKPTTPSILATLPSPSSLAYGCSACTLIVCHTCKEACSSALQFRGGEVLRLRVKEDTESGSKEEEDA
ncbi:predicted protein [Plenodomus lingam JN3]|uniref:Predicted protein n=1 Tax=Leptosphaeria maculans (strain JN3 / isolate v23.1.3 / race Av1-4-5-6-7-8) TaxID=985895 RepID=E5AA97_LEPMJ|nr:predicted protein [Plenodomus lingam JN3]CBY00588.1 predicted protein [Plenodomus lingam JN3]